jgi:hypothetical protein
MKKHLILSYIGFFILLLNTANYVGYWSIISESTIVLLKSQPLYFIIIALLIMAPIFSIISLKYKRVEHLVTYCDEILGLILILILFFIFIFYQTSIVKLITEPLYIISILLIFTPLRLMLEHVKLLTIDDNPLKVGLLTINFYILMIIMFTSQKINVTLTGNYLQDFGFRFSMLTLYMFKYVLPWITLPVSLEQSIAYLKIAISAYEIPPIIGLLFISSMLIILFKPERKFMISNIINILLYSSLGLLAYLFLFNNPSLFIFQSISPWLLLFLTTIILLILGVLK